MARDLRDKAAAREQDDASSTATVSTAPRVPSVTSRASPPPMPSPTPPPPVQSPPSPSVASPDRLCALPAERRSRSTEGGARPADSTHRVAHGAHHPEPATCARVARAGLAASEAASEVVNEALESAVAARLEQKTMALVRERLESATCSPPPTSSSGEARVERLLALLEAQMSAQMSAQMGGLVLGPSATPPRTPGAQPDHSPSGPTAVQFERLVSALEALVHERARGEPAPALPFGAALTRMGGPPAPPWPADIALSTTSRSASTSSSGSDSVVSPPFGHASPRYSCASPHAHAPRPSADYLPSSPARAVHRTVPVARRKLAHVSRRRSPLRWTPIPHAESPGARRDARADWVAAPWELW